MNLAFRFLLTTIGILLLPMVDLAIADSDGDLAEGTDWLILEAGEIDTSTVRLGAYAVVIHGQGKRHPVSGEWERLNTVRGYIQVVDAEPLILSRRKGVQERIILEKIQTMVLTKDFSPDKDRDITSTGTQIDPGDSLMAKEIRPFEEYVELRIFQKMVAGTASGAVVTGLAFIALDRLIERKAGWEPDIHREVGILLVASAIGCSFGFPLGVSLLDPYDSIYKTLLAGAIPGVAGYSILWSQEHTGKAALLMYVAPVINSLLVSELWRNPPEARRISFAVTPTPKGGLSAVTELRF